MSFRTKKSLDMYCKSSYILLVVAACAVTTGGEESSATVGKTKVISTTGTGGTSSLQRLGSGGLGSSSQLQRTSSLGSGSLSSTGTGNATVGSTGRLSISSVGSGVSQQSGLVVIDPSSGIPTGKVQHKYGVSAGDFDVSEVPGGINPGERYVQFINTEGKLVTYKEGLSTKLKLLWKESEIGRDHYVGSDGKVHSYIYRSKPNWVSGLDILNAQGGDGGSSGLPQQQGNISSSVTGLGNKSVGTQTDTGNLGGLGTSKKDTSTSPTTKKFTSQLNLNVDKYGNITKQNKGTNTGDGAGLGTNDGISKTQLNVNGDGKVVSKSIGTNTGTPSGVSETELNIDGSGKVTTRSVGTNTESVGETTSVVTPLGGDKDFSDSSTQTVISGSGLQPKKSTNKGVGTQTDPSITGEGLTSLVAKSDESQTSSGDGGSITVKSVVYNFGKMPRFTAKGSEGDAVKPSTGSQTSSQGDVDGGSIPVNSVVYKFGSMPKFTAKGSESDTVKPSTGTQTSSGDVDGGSSPVKSIVYNFDKMPKFTAKGNESDTGKTSTSVGTDVASGGEKTTKPLTDTGSGGDGKTYTSTLKINLGGKGQQSSSTQTGSGAAAQGSSGASPSGSRGASLGQQSSSSQTGSGAGAQGSSGSSPSGNKGALSSGQQGQGSLSQQSASGSGAQGGSGDGSGGKKTPSSPVSGQATSSSAQQIEVKDEEGKTHQAVLVNTKGTSGGGASKKPGLSTIVEEGESSKAIGEQGKKSSSTQTGGAGAQGSSGSSPSGNKGALSSGQQGQGSLSQQSSSGSGAQGGSGDGSGGKRTPSSPVSGQATSSSAQRIEVKDEEGKTHQAVLVNTKGTSGGGVQGSSGSSPSGSRGASLGQQSSSMQTGSGAAAQGGSGLSTSGNKGASSSGQQGQGSSSQQSASGSGAQGGSGDGSGGKRTPSSPVSGQATSSSAQQIEVKDEEGKTHQAVLVNTKGTSGGGASKKPGLSTIVEEGESSKAIGEQGKKSSSTQTGGAGAQKGSGASTSGSRGASLGQQSSSSQTGSGAGAQGSSGSSTSGKGASSSGQQGQGSSSQQSASGSGAQGGSGDGSGGKKTPPSGQQGGDEDGIFVSKKDAEKFNPTYVGKSLEELMKMSNSELRDYFLKRNPEDDFKGIDLSAAKGLAGDELDEFVNTHPVITYELDGNGYTIVEVNNTPHILGTGGKVTRKAFGKLPDGRVIESIFIERYVGYRDAVESSRHSSSTTSTGTVSQGGNTTGTVPSGQTAQFETSGGAGAQGASGASAGGSKASSSSSAQKEQGKKGTGDSSSKPIYVGTSLKDLQGLNEEELINYSKNAPTIDWDKVKLALPKASTEEEAKDFAKKNPVYTYEVDDLGDLVEVNNSRWLYGVGEKTISKVFDSDGKPLDISKLEVRFRPYLSQKGDSKVSSTGTKPSTSGSGIQGSGGASQKEGSDSSSTTGNQGGSKVGTSVVGETGQTSTSGEAGTQASSEVNKGGSKTSSTSVEQQKQWDGSGKVDFDEVKKLLKPVSGTTTGKETQGSEGIDLNEARKNLRPVSGTTTGKETQGSEGIDLNETRKNLRPVSGTTTGKETQGSEGIDLNEAKKNLRPVSGTTTGKETQGSEGIDLNEAKKNLRPVSGTTTGKETQGSEGIDLNEAKKNLRPVSGTTTGKETQGSEGIDLNEVKKQLKPVSASGQIELKDEDGNTHRAVLVDVKGTSEGVSKRPGLSTIVEEGESSEGLKQQSSSTQTGSGAQGSSGTQSSSGDGGSIPVRSVVYNFGNMPRFTAEGSEGGSGTSGQQGQSSLSQTGSGAQGSSGTQSSSGDGGSIPVRSVVYNFGNMPRFTAEGSEGGSGTSGQQGQSSLSQTGSGAQSSGTQSSSGDGGSIPVRSVVYNFGNMPRFTAEGSEGGSTISGQQGQGSSTQAGGAQGGSSPSTSGSKRASTSGQQEGDSEGVFVSKKVSEQVKPIYVGKRLEELKALSIKELKKYANRNVDDDFKDIKLNVSKEVLSDEDLLDDFIIRTPVISYEPDEDGIHIYEVNNTAHILGKGSRSIRKVFLRRADGETFDEMILMGRFGDEKKSSDTSYVTDKGESRGNTGVITSGGSRTQGGSGDGLGIKKTLSSPSGQIELKDEDGNTHIAVLVDIKETSEGVSERPGLSTIVEEGESSQVLKQQSSLTQIGSGDGHETTRMVPGVSTARFVTSVVKAEQASSESVKGEKLVALLMGKQTQQGSSSETVVEQGQSSLKKGSTTTTTDKSSGSSGGIDFDEAKSSLKKVEQTKTEEKSSSSLSKDFEEARKKLKSVTQSEKSGGESSGAVTKTELQTAIASLKKTGSIGQGMYDSDSDDDNNDISKYILLGKSYGTSGGRGQIDFQKNVSTDETLVSSQGKEGFVKAAGQIFKTFADEDQKTKVSNQTGVINIQTSTNTSGGIKINTSITSKSLEDGIGPLNVDPKFAKTLAKNIKEGYEKRKQEQQINGFNQ